jgi:hypothetical protein
MRVEPATEGAAANAEPTPGPISRRPAARPGLSRAARANARAIAEALWTRDGRTPPPAHRLDWLERDLADFAGHLTLRARLLLSACLATVTWLAPVAIGRLARLRSLSIADRVRAIAAIERAPLVSLALFAAKAILSLLWWEHPENAREIGWDQKCLRSSS